jgi:hypothetical protein
MKEIRHAGWETARTCNDSEGAKAIAIEFALGGWDAGAFENEDDFAMAFCGSDDADIALGLEDWDRDGFGECDMDELEAAARAYYQERQNVR